MMTVLRIAVTLGRVCLLQGYKREPSGQPGIFPYLDLDRGCIWIKFHWAVHSWFLYFNVYKEYLNLRKKSKSPYWIYFWYRLAIQVKIMLTTEIILLSRVEIYFWIYSTSLNIHTSNSGASSLWIQILYSMPIYWIFQLIAFQNVIYFIGSLWL